jgi:hypothetical protein
MLTQFIAVAASIICSMPGPASGDLTWLTGTWRKDDDNGYSEVTFGPQYNMRMGGVLRAVSKDKTVLMELISIEASSKGATMLVRHFSADLEPREAMPLSFNLVEGCARKATFENTAGEGASPRRSTYWIDEKGELRIVIEGVQAADGGTRTFESKLSRVQ